MRVRMVVGAVVLLAAAALASSPMMPPASLTALPPDVMCATTVQYWMTPDGRVIHTPTLADVNKAVKAGILPSITEAAQGGGPKGQTDAIDEYVWPFHGHDLYQRWWNKAVPQDTLQTRWSAPYSSAAWAPWFGYPVCAEGRVVYQDCGTGLLNCRDTTDGSLVWSKALQAGNYYPGTPVIFAGTGGEMWVAIPNYGVGGNDPTMSCFKLSDGSLVWSNKVPLGAAGAAGTNINFNRPVYFNGYIYEVTLEFNSPYGGIFYRVNALTGDTATMSKAGSSCGAAPTIDPTGTFAYWPRWNPASPSNCRILKINLSTKAIVDSSPVQSNYLRGSLCLNPTTMRLFCEGSPSTSGAGIIACYDANNLAAGTIWTTPTNGGHDIQYTSIDDDNVYVCTQASPGLLYAVKQTDGSAAWGSPGYITIPGGGGGICDGGVSISGGSGIRNLYLTPGYYGGGYLVVLNALTGATVQMRNVSTSEQMFTCGARPGGAFISKSGYGTVYYWRSPNDLTIAHDIACRTILSPSGTVDSGQQITPRAVVSNAGKFPEDYTAHFILPGSYVDSVTKLAVPAGQTDTIIFTPWVAIGRDTALGVAYTTCLADSFPADDTARVRFLVRVKDIAVVELIEPHDTLDSGTVVTPQCRVWNYGNQTLTFDVRFTIGAYLSTRTLTLMAGGATVVSAPAPYTAVPGVWLYSAFAVVTGDLHPENNLMQDTIWVRGTINHDVGCTAILSPGGFVDTLTTVTPSGLVENFTGNAETFMTFFTVTNSGGAQVYRDSLTVMIGGNSSTPISFTPTKFTTLGAYVMACSTALAGDQNSTNDVKHGPLTVVPVLQGDVGVVSIIKPLSYVPINTDITPTAKWKNYSDQATSFIGYAILINPYTARVYTNSSAQIDLAPFAETTLAFPVYNVGTVEGHWVARCSTFAGDTTPGNDVLEKPFTVSSAPPWPEGWVEVTQVPTAPSGKAVKDGGWLATDAGSGLIYGAKGNKTGDFYAFEPNAGTWTQKALIPTGTEGKPPSKGATGCSDGNGKLYATKGNNKLGFYEYDAVKDSWYQKKDVPLGGGKKLKGGSGLAWATKAGVGAAYLLKGYKNEFYKYNPVDSTWTTLPVAPAGGNVKWDKGSWLVSDGNHTLYAHKAKYHEFYTYDTDTDTWSAAKTAMPIPGSAGNKKSKDGGAAAWLDGQIYAFKGGNTQEFWRYTPLGDSWKEMDTIPRIGSTGKKKKVKAGGALAAYQGTAVFAFKGNKCVEFWRYVPHATSMDMAGREGVMSGVQTGLTGALRISPNPLVGGFATVRYSLPKAGLATLRLYDVAGRTVMSQVMVAGRTGTAGLDLRKLNAGVYLVKVTTDGFSTTQKLVVQH